MKLLLFLVLLVCSADVQAQNDARESFNAVKNFYGAFDEYQRKLSKENIKESDLQWLVDNLNNTNPHFEKLKKLQNPSYEEKKWVNYARYVFIDANFRIGLDYFSLLAQPEKAFEQINKCLPDLILFDNALNFPILFGRYGNIHHEDVRDYPVRVYRIMSSVAIARSSYWDIYRFNDMILGERYATAWEKYWSCYIILTHEKELEAYNHVISKEVLLDVLLTWLKTFPELSGKDKLTIAQEKLPDLESCSQSALAFAEANPGLNKNGKIFWDYAHILYNKNDLKAALEYYSKAVMLTTRFAATDVDIAIEVALKLNNKEMAKRIADAIISKTESLGMMCNLLKNLAKIYNFLGMKKDARMYEKKHKKC